MAKRRKASRLSQNRLTVCLTTAQREILDRMAAKNNVSTAFVVRQLLAEYFNGHAQDPERVSFGRGSQRKRGH